MIDLIDKNACCGCESCVQVCPQGCISLSEDEEGFAYPVIEQSSCIDCHRCERCCPVIHPSNKHTPLRIVAGIHPSDAVRATSSAGGVFTLLSERVLAKGGVVFGARFDGDWRVVHDFTQTVDGLDAFRGSKYVQSGIGESYRQTRTFLQAGREVLFSGTPCQISALKLFLGKDFKNLLCVECLCHGVPSPGLWRRYLRELCDRFATDLQDLATVRFRDKRDGWKAYRISFSYKNGTQWSEPHETNAWMRGFIGNLYLRPSCFNCTSKAEYSRADIGLGDLWGITSLVPQIDDDKGHCVVLAHTAKGVAWLEESGLSAQGTFTLEQIAHYNPAVAVSAEEPAARKRFYRLLQKAKRIEPLIRKLTRPSRRVQMRAWAGRLYHKFIP